MENRECGECNKCCYILNVPEYDSPINTNCKHCTNSGCSIHEKRDNICRQFNCLWKTQEQIPEDLRPDKCHVMFELPAYSKTYIGYVDPDYPDAYKADNIRTLIQKITEADHPVMIYSGENKKKRYALPKGMTLEDIQKDIQNAYIKNKDDGRI